MQNGKIVSVNLKACADELRVGSQERRLRKQQSVNDAGHFFSNTTRDFSLLEERYNIKKTPQDYIDVQPGGVVGDYHFIPKYILESPTWDRNMLEVLLWDTSSLDYFNQVLQCTAGPGDIGENILLEGFDVNNLFKGDILFIGKSAKLVVTGRRSFCFKFVLAFKNRVIHPETTIDVSRVGIGAKVIQPGRIHPGDRVLIEHTDQSVPLEYRKKDFSLSQFINR